MAHIEVGHAILASAEDANIRCYTHPQLSDLLVSCKVIFWRSRHTLRCEWWLTGGSAARSSSFRFAVRTRLAGADAGSASARWRLTSRGAAVAAGAGPRDARLGSPKALVSVGPK